MSRLRERARNDAKRNITDWGFLIKMTDPDGITQELDAETGEPLKTLQTLSDTVQFTPDSGDDMLTNVSMVSLHKDSLSRVPQSGERWFLEIQFEPNGPFISKVMTEVRAPEGGASIGFINIFMQNIGEV